MTSADQLQGIFNELILFDANIFMVGIENREIDGFGSFNHIKEVLLIPIFESFENILIDIKVLEELDSENRALIEKYKGEISSLAYAAYKNVNYFCSRDAAVDLAADELDILASITIITMESVILCATMFHLKADTYNEHKKSLKSMYKRFCPDVIKRKKLPKTYNEFIDACQIDEIISDLKLIED